MPPCLLYNSILTTYNDGHATEVTDFGPAYHQRVDVKATPGEDARYAGQYTRFVLHQAVKDVSVLGFSKRWTEVDMGDRVYFLKGCKLGGGVL